ncbi:cupin domain-containing protein [Mangrovibacter sp. SLW1]
MKPEQRHRKRFLQRNKKGGIELENLTWHHKGGLLQGDIHIIEPGVKSDALIEHQGEEMGYVLEGVLELRIGEETWQLEAGDSFYFPSHLPHGYSNPGKSVTKVLWVNTPVTF